MKVKPEKRGLGALLIFIAWFGIIFSIFGMAVTWYYRPRIQATVFGLIDSLDDIFTNTNDGLIIIDGTLESASDNLSTISGTLENLNTTMDNISVSLESSADLIGGDLRTTIIDTQIALSSAADSAQLIDNTLRFIASIPLLGADYQPEVPLSISLAQVSESLDGVPTSFLEIEQFIRDTEGSITVLSTDVTNLANEIGSYESDLSGAQNILTEYTLIFDDLRNQLADLRHNTSTFLLIASILISGAFFLLAVAQLNILRIGKNYRHGETVTVSLADLRQEE
jgi:hypothetical protein